MNRAAIWSRDSTSGHLYKENGNTNFERYLHPQVHSSIIYNSQEAKISFFINRQMNEAVVYVIYMYIYIHGEENGNPLQYPCLENSMDRGAWWATYSPRGHKESDTTE